MSPPENPARRTASYAARGENGKRYKVRVMATPEAARQVEMLTNLLHRHARGLDPAASFEIPRILGRSECALVSEWVVGDSADTTAGLERFAGNLLGRIHTCPLESDELVAFAGQASEERAALHRRVDDLLALGHLSRREAGSVSRWCEEFRDDSPGAGIVHRDFCPPNLVLDPRGVLWPIDNETLAVRPLDYDLGRTWTHWSMRPDGWRRFFEGYSHERSPQSYFAHFPYWALTACVESASFRAVHWTGGTSRPLQRLRALLSGLENGSDMRDLVAS